VVSRVRIAEYRWSGENDLDDRLFARRPNKMLLTRFERNSEPAFKITPLLGSNFSPSPNPKSTAQDGGDLGICMYVGSNPMVRKIEALNDYFRHGRVANERRDVRPWNTGCPFPTTASPGTTGRAC